MDRNEHSKMPMDTTRKSKTSKKSLSLRPTGAGKGKEPRSSSTDNKRTPGASPAPTGREQATESRGRERGAN